MALYPAAVKKLLPENSTQGRISPRAVILHTAVDSASPNSSIFGYFARGDVEVESHFYVLDNGTVEQYMDTSVRADANLDANAFAISIETEDDGNPNQTPWNPAQLSAIIKLIDWLCSVHNIPKRRIDRWDGSGIGYHSMWGAPSHWTPSAGKTCPGPARIDQVGYIIQQVESGEVVTPEDINAIAKATADKVLQQDIWDQRYDTDGNGVPERNLIDIVVQTLINTQKSVTVTIPSDQEDRIVDKLVAKLAPVLAGEVAADLGERLSE